MLPLRGFDHELQACSGGPDCCSCSWPFRAACERRAALPWNHHLRSVRPRSQPYIACTVLGSAPIPPGCVPIEGKLPALSRLGLMLLLVRSESRLFVRRWKPASAQLLPGTSVAWPRLIVSGIHAAVPQIGNVWFLEHDPSSFPPD
jgi:hypothetical protein